MSRRILVALLCAVSLAGCSSTSNDLPCAPSCAARQCGDDGCGASCGGCAAGSVCSGGICVISCVPDCGGKQCGDDGCGGSCGSCPAGSGCLATGACAILRCPSADQQCVVEEHTAYQYVCDYQPPPGTTTCERLSVIGTYLSFDDCWTACAGGNSSCGDQHGQMNSEVAACLACTDSCHPGQAVACPGDPAAACQAPCWCQ
jgi:hypothetical protein